MVYCDHHYTKHYTLVHCFGNKSLKKKYEKNTIIGHGHNCH